MATGERRMDYEGEAFDVCEDFEKEFADELEMLEHMGTEPTSQGESESYYQFL